MKQSVANKVFSTMKQNRRGKIFFTNDFVKFGSYEACSKALDRLTQQGKIMRVDRGIYTLPKKSELLGTLTPSADEVVRAVLKRDNAKVVPTGVFAENRLGLSTQLPMNIVYLTDGTPRKLTVGKTTINFKKTAPKNLATKGELSTLAIQALKSIGKSKVTDEQEKKIASILKKENQKHLEHDIKFAPQWIQKIMRKALTE